MDPHGLQCGRDHLRPSLVLEKELVTEPDPPSPTDPLRTSMGVSLPLPGLRVWVPRTPPSTMSPVPSQQRAPTHRNEASWVPMGALGWVWASHCTPRETTKQQSTYGGVEGEGRGREAW